MDRASITAAALPQGKSAFDFLNVDYIASVHAMLNPRNVKTIRVIDCQLGSYAALSNVS